MKFSSSSMKCSGAGVPLARSKPVNTFFILFHTQKSGSLGLNGKNINILNQSWCFASQSLATSRSRSDKHLQLEWKEAQPLRLLQNFFFLWTSRRVTENAELGKKEKFPQRIQREKQLRALKQSLYKNRRKENPQFEKIQTYFSLNFF